MSSVNTNTEVDSVLLQIRQLVSNNQNRPKAKPRVSEVILDDETLLAMLSPNPAPTAPDNGFHIDDDLEHIEHHTTAPAAQTPVAVQNGPVANIQDYQTEMVPADVAIEGPKSRLKSLISWRKSKSERAHEKVETTKAASVLENAMENKLDQVFYRPKPNKQVSETAKAPRELTAPAETTKKSSEPMMTRPIVAPKPVEPQEAVATPAPAAEQPVAAKTEPSQRIRSLVASPEVAQSEPAPVETPEIRSFLESEAEAHRPLHEELASFVPTSREQAQKVAQVNVVDSQSVEAVHAPIVAPEPQPVVTETTKAGDPESQLTSFSDLKAAMSREVFEASPQEEEAPVAEESVEITEELLETLIPVSDVETGAGYATFSSRRSTREDQASDEVEPVEEPLSAFTPAPVTEIALDEKSPDTTTQLVADLLVDREEEVAPSSGLQRISSESDIIPNDIQEVRPATKEDLLEDQVGSMIEADLVEKLGADVANAVKLLIRQEVRAAAKTL